MQLCGWLCAKQLALTGATLLLEHERGRQAIEPTPIEIALGEPTWHEEHLVRLIKERLGRIELTAPVIALRLDASKRATCSACIGHAVSRSPAARPRTTPVLSNCWLRDLAKKTYFGLRRPRITDLRLPIDGCLSQGVEKHVLPEGLPRPTWLLENPVRLLMRKHRPFYGSPLRMVSPGERIEAGWFDGELVTRDYFVAQGEDQSCFWIYRERVSSRDAEEDQRWFLHGLFG